jgi:hypothetical protein
MPSSNVTRHSSVEAFSPHRRVLLGALGAGALGAWLGGCATTTTQELRRIDPAQAPRVGDTWQYAFRSVFRMPAPRALEVRVLEIRSDDVRDRITAEGEAETEDHSFTSALEMADRPVGAERRLVDRVVPRLTVVEFSPYLQAFGPLPDGGPVVVARPGFGPPFTGRARLRGNERVTVPAGTFDATRMDYDISRTPSVTMRPQFDPAFTLGSVWYAPAVKRPVRWTVVTRASELNVLVDDTYELAAYRPA